MSGRRMSLLPPLSGVGRRYELGDWPDGAAPQHDGAVIVHVATDPEQLPGLAAVVWALEKTGAFDQLIVDAGHGAVAEPALRGLGLQTPVRRAGPEPGTLVARLEQELAGVRSIATILYGCEDDSAAASAALCAARQGTAIVYVGRLGAGAQRSSAGRVVCRLADLLLVHDEDDAQGAGAPDVAARVHVVGNPLTDAVRRLSGQAVGLARWQQQGVEHGRYALAVLTRRGSATRLAGRLATAAAIAPLVVEAPPDEAGALAVAVAAGARVIGEQGLLDRLSLEHGAGVIITDSPATEDVAEALGIPCHADGDPRSAPSLSLDLEALASDRPPRAIPMRDARASERVARILVANFGRVRLS